MFSSSDEFVCCGVRTKKFRSIAGPAAARSCGPEKLETEFHCCRGRCQTALIRCGGERKVTG